MLDEQKRQIDKQNNLVIFGAPELNDEVIEADMLTKIIRVSSQSCKIRIHRNNFQRIGCAGNKCRPIRLICHNNNENLQCLSFKNLLKRDQDYNKIFISNDLTQIQREKRRRKVSVFANVNRGHYEHNDVEFNEGDHNEMNQGQSDRNEVGQSPLHYENVNMSKRRTDQPRNNTQVPN